MNDKSDDILANVHPRPDRKVQGPERLMISIPEDEILRMLDLVNEAEFPKVTFSGNMKEMTQEAANLRECSLQQLRYLIEKHSKFL